MVASCCLLTAVESAFAQGTGFTYQGRLNDGANSANGDYDLRLTIYDALTGGSAVGGPLTNAPTSVSNGLFTVTLDFGPGVFSGADRWLEIGVRTNGSAAAYQTLSPRQQLTATPYAARAQTVTSVPDTALSANVPLLDGSPIFSTPLSATLLRVSSPGSGSQLRFGPTDDCSIGTDPVITGLLLRDPRGIRVLSPDTQQPPTLRFGPTDDCSIGIDPVITGLILRDPGGLRIAPANPVALPRLKFGPTDDCSIGIDPAFPGLIERDPIGFRLLGPNNQGCRLIFGPTMDCTVEVDPAGPQGLLLRDPKGIRVLSPSPTSPPTVRFGPTDRSEGTRLNSSHLKLSRMPSSA